MSAENPSRQPSIEEIAKSPYPDFSWPLETARAWVRSNDEQLRSRAPELLRRLRERFPHALQFGEEEVLALIECDRLREAQRVLEAIEPEFGAPDEEILCRWGRLYKDRGDEHLRAAGDMPTNHRLAAEFYRKAAERYGQAYDIRHGHYPGINQATLLLILASLIEPERESLLQDCEQVAENLLAQRNSWPKTYADDSLWHLATAGEACLLQRNWSEAAHYYRLAQREPMCQPFYRQSMRKQAERILAAYRRMGEHHFGPFDDLDQIFPPTRDENELAPSLEEDDSAGQS